MYISVSGVEIIEYIRDTPLQALIHKYTRHIHIDVGYIRTSIYLPSLEARCEL